MATSAKKKKDSHPEEVRKMYGRRDLLKGIALAGLGAGVAGLLSGMKISEAAVDTTKPAVVSQFSQIGDASVVVFQDSNNVYYAIDKGGVTGQVGKIIASGTDAASVIQQAHDALPTGGTIFLKGGVYTLLSRRQIPTWDLTRYAAIVIQKPIKLKGEGMGKTILKLGNGVGGNVIAVSPNVNYFEIEDIEIDGNKANNPDTGLDGDGAGILPTAGIDHYNIKNVLVRNTARQGYYLRGGWAHLENLRAYNCGSALDGGEGISIDAMDYFTLVNPMVLNCQRGIFWVGGATASVIQGKIIGGSIYGTNGFGLYIRYVIGGRVHGLEARNCGFGGIETATIMVRDSTEVELHGVKGFEAWEYGLWIYQSNKIHVLGGIYKNNSQRSAGIAFGVGIFSSNDCELLGLTVVDTQASKTQEGIQEYGTSNNNIIAYCDVKDNLMPLVTTVGANTLVINNKGYNPQGFNITTPAMPASGTAQTNTFPFPVIVYLYGGTVTQITINGQVVFSSGTGISLTGQSFTLNPRDTIAITYTAAPTWKWYGL